MFKKTSSLCIICSVLLPNLAVAQEMKNELPGPVQQVGSESAQTVVPVENDNTSQVQQGEISSSTSSLPPFQLHTIQKEIWSPIRTNSLMQGIADQSMLSGTATNLSSGVSVPFLQGQVSRDGDGGPLTTIQRLLRPRILSGYTMLQAQIPDRDLFREVATQIAKNSPNLNAEVSKMRKEMDAQLAHPKPIPVFNLDALKMPKMPAPTVVLEPQVARTDPNLQAQIILARQQMDWQLANSHRSTNVVEGMPGVPLRQGIDIDLDTQIRVARQQESSNVELMKRQMQAELARAKTGVTPDIRPDRMQLDRAKKETSAEIAAAKPALDAILTNLRLSPKLMMPSSTPNSTQSVNAELSYEKVIPWDKWYAKVAKLYEPLLLKAIARHGSPEGYNTVSITVSRNHQVEVSLQEADNSAFDIATLEAYRALNGNPILEFPQGTHRTQVSFLIDNKHNNPAPVSRVSSKTYTGDKEIQGYKWKK